MRSGADPDKSYSDLLSHGYCEVLEANPREGADTQAWFELALPWWEAMVARAEANGLPILCYRGRDEMGVQSASASLLHPHSSAQLVDYPEFRVRTAREVDAGFDFLGPEFSGASSVISHWRRLARTSPPEHPEITDQAEADYAQLVRDGEVGGPFHPYPVNYHATSEWRQQRDAELRAWEEAELFPWWEAITAQARRDGVPILCDRAYGRTGPRDIQAAAHRLDPQLRMPLAWLAELRAEARSKD